MVPIPEHVKQIPGRTSKATHDLIFIAKDLPPLGIASFYIEVEKGKNNPTDKTVPSATNDTLILDNGVSDQNSVNRFLCPRQLRNRLNEF